MEKYAYRQAFQRWAARNFVAKGKQGKVDISIWQKSGHFYLALTVPAFKIGFMPKNDGKKFMLMREFKETLNKSSVGLIQCFLNITMP